MKDFYQKHVQGVRPVDIPYENPLRILRDGHRNTRDVRFSMWFYHRKDTDFLVDYSINFSPYEQGNNGNAIDALAYLRRRMSYTQTALRSNDDLDTQVVAWVNTGIRPRIGGFRNDQIKRYFAAHRATYLALREFLGDDILQEFLAVTPEGSEDE